MDVTVSDYGAGRPFLLCTGRRARHVARFGETLADRQRRVLSTHPGFAAPPARGCTPGPAALYVALLDQLGLDVIGNSIGGWIAAEMAILNSPRVSRVILIDAVGLEVPGHPVADFFSLTMDQVFELSFHDPAPFRIDPATLPPAAQAIAAANRATLATYAGTAMTDPTLAGRLADVAAPTLVVWGDSDRIVDPGYGRAFADAIPKARFELLTAPATCPGRDPRPGAPGGPLKPAAAGRPAARMPGSALQAQRELRAHPDCLPGVRRERTRHVPARTTGKPQSSRVMSSGRISAHSPRPSQAMGSTRSRRRAVIAGAGEARAGPRPSGSRSTSRPRAAPVRPRTRAVRSGSAPRRRRDDCTRPARPPGRATGAG